MKRLWALLGAVTLLVGVAAADAQEQHLWGGVAPVEVVIPRLGGSAPIVPVGLTEDEAMEAPSDPDTVGWYSLGPGVGTQGNAVLAGHADWGGHVRLFGGLRELSEGDLVRVLDATGGWQTYAVEWSAWVDADIDPAAVFHQGEREELTLITCGGVFDPATRQYLSRLVVRAVRVG